jgi:hypothetical protein
MYTDTLNKLDDLFRQGYVIGILIYFVLSKFSVCLILCVAFIFTEIVKIDEKGSFKASKHDKYQNIAGLV